MLVGGVALWWWFSGDSEDDTVEDVAIDEATGRERGSRFDERDWEEAGPTPRRTPSNQPSPLSPPRATDTPRYVSGRTVGPREVYRVSTEYPRTSRPLDPVQHHDLIDFNAQQVSSNVVEGDEDTTYLFSGDMYWVLGDATLTSWLQVSRDDEPIEAEVTQAWARLHAARGEPLSAAQLEPIPIEYTRDGDRMVNQLKPEGSFPPVGRPVNMVLYVEFTYDGAPGPVRASLATLWNPPGQEPARFTGDFSDVVEAGSVAVYVGLDVDVPGYYHVDANLWGSDGEPVGWAKWTGDLEAGPQQARLLFFGRVITDSETEPPWRVEQLRGFRYAEDRTPAVQPLVPFEGSYTLTSTLADGISDAAWDDPDREARLAELDRIESLGGGNPPVPIESFLGNLPPAQRAREAERLGVNPADFTPEALAEVELRPNEGI